MQKCRPTLVVVDVHPYVLMNRVLPAEVVGKSGLSRQQGRVGATEPNR